MLGHAHLFAYGWQSHQSLLTKPLDILLYLHLAVVVFLVISGFSLALPIVHNANRLNVSMSAFFVARARRILPPYYAILSLIMLVNFFVPLAAWGRHPAGLSADIPWQVWLVNYSLMQDFFPQYSTVNGPFWSIALEWHIYFLLPLLALILARLGGLLFLPVALALAAAIEWFATHPPQFLQGLNMTILHPSYFVFLFVMGIFAAWMAFGYRKSFAWPEKLCMLMLTCAVCSFLLTQLLQYPINDLASAMKFADHSRTIDLAFAPLSAILLLWLVRGESRLKSLCVSALESNKLVRIGHFSYSLYLVHIPILAIVNHSIESLRLPTNLAHLHFALLVVIGGAISLCFAFYFSRLFETMKWLEFLKGAFRRSKKAA